MLFGIVWYCIPLTWILLYNISYLQFFSPGDKLAGEEQLRKSSSPGLALKGLPPTSLSLPSKALPPHVAHHAMQQQQLRLLMRNKNAAQVSDKRCSVADIHKKLYRTVVLEHINWTKLKLKDKSNDHTNLLLAKLLDIVL